MSAQRLTRENESITLLPAEALLRELLLRCREDIQKAGVAGNLEIWITGGWVRDRLLGLPFSDVDIALSTMIGEHFGSYLTKFSHRNEAFYQERAAELRKLETVVGRLFGLDIDLVNLRREVYEESSRTPEMEFGTAKNDAFRRDATINALFFNLDSQQVVDLTKKGLGDMASCIIRTPLEPRQTFLDDPLRVLRLIQIGSKLGYTIDEESKNWMRDQRIHNALEAKISRERIGIEVFKIMKNSNPQSAFHLIFESNLYSTVFLKSNPKIV
ncbi:hypothetical protein GGR58DRAFT_525231 [Xylaria digitata]|nr:hypothetical protein GGR58DRAFT_525231 [Xylaria digitata]